MLLTIPTSPGYDVKPGVIDSIKALNGLYDQVVCCDGVDFKELCKIPDATERRFKIMDNICLSRNACLAAVKTHFETTADEYAVMNDADCKHLQKNSITLAVQYLNDNPRFAVVALADYDPMTYSGFYIRSGVWVFHKRFFALNLQFTHTQLCECATMSKAINNAELTTGYLPGKRIERI